MTDYLYFPNNKRHKRPHIELYSKLQNLFLIKSYNFQRKHKLITTLFFFTAAFFSLQLKHYSSRTNYRVQNWSNIFESFITIPYEFEKQ